MGVECICSPLGVWVENFCFINGFSYQGRLRSMGFISKSIFEDILSLVLQNRFADIEQLSDPQNEALNPEDVFAIIPTSTCHGKSIIIQCLPDLCRELFLRRFPYPSNAAVVVVCPLNSLVKSHIRELHTRGITAKGVNFLLQRTKRNRLQQKFHSF